MLTILGYITLLIFTLLITAGFITLSIVSGYFGGSNIGGRPIDTDERIGLTIMLLIVVGSWYLTITQTPFTITLN